MISGGIVRMEDIIGVMNDFSMEELEEIIELCEEGIEKIDGDDSL